jgi:superfamily II DNA/RNA helicase
LYNCLDVKEIIEIIRFMKFTEFNLHERLLEAISYMGIIDASPIQEKAIPEILNGRDIIACAQTGTGKTAAFVLPVLNNIIDRETKGINTIIVVPTRELAVQIDQQIQGFSYFLSASSIPVYGGGTGQDWDSERTALTGNTDFIVATPGRLIAHLNMGYVNTANVKHLILDEADRMLDMGFYEDIQKIVSFLPKERQTLLFSATMPPKIRQLAGLILNDPFEVTIELSKPAEGVLQAAYICYDHQKVPIIVNLIADKPEYKSILVFTSTKSKVSEIVRGLKNKGFDTEGISSNLEQNEREEVLLKFRSKQTRVLVATDVLSRGIDIKEIELIINYDVPQDAEDYVHRVGRTARANTSGVAITFINEQDMVRFKRIEDLIENEVYKLPVPEELGETPVWSTKPVHRSGNKKKGFFSHSKNKNRSFKK